LVLSVAVGEQGGAVVKGRSQSIFVVLAGRRDENLIQPFASKEPDPTDELCQSLFAQITEIVMGHKTEDWPGYYDKLSALICRVIARSSLSAESKAVLTRRLIQHVVELESWWPRLKPL
jgi:hypothetical protein